MAQTNNFSPQPGQGRLKSKIRCYIAVINQTGTNDPTAKVLSDSISPYQSGYNQFASTPNKIIQQQLVWTRTGVGTYRLTATPANPQYAAFPDITNIVIRATETSGTGLQLKGVKSNDNFLTFTQTTIDSPFTATDGLTNVSIEIYTP